MRFREPIDRAKLAAMKPKPGQRVRWSLDGREYTVQSVGLRYLYMLDENGTRTIAKLTEVSLV